MSWLSEIEGDFQLYASEKTRERMARVIGELAEVAHLFSEGKRAAVYEAIANLSPDAKEVIDESTAPRST